MSNFVLKALGILVLNSRSIQSVGGPIFRNKEMIEQRNKENEITCEQMQR